MKSILLLCFITLFPVIGFSAARRASLTGPAITAGAVTGAIYTCAGAASASPDIQQFKVSGSALTANITATAPANFEVSLEFDTLLR